MLTLSLLLSLAACTDGKDSADNTGTTDSGTTGNTDDTGTTDDTAKTDDTGTTGGLDGEQLFLTNCSGCHGTDAMGSNNGPPLDREVQMLSDNQLIGIMQNGEGRMPGIEVSVEEAQEIVNYLRTLFP